MKPYTDCRMTLGRQNFSNSTKRASARCVRWACSCMNRVLTMWIRGCVHSSSSFSSLPAAIALLLPSAPMKPRRPALSGIVCIRWASNTDICHRPMEAKRPTTTTAAAAMTPRAPADRGLFRPNLPGGDSGTLCASLLEALRKPLLVPLEYGAGIAVGARPA